MTLRRLFVVGCLSVVSITAVIIFAQRQGHLAIETRFYKSEVRTGNDFYGEDVHVLKIQLERLNQLSKVCKMKKQTSQGNRLKVFVDEQANVAYVSIPKVACTSWKMLFVTRVAGNISLPKSLIHKLPFLKKVGIQVDELTIKQAKKRLQHLKTFAFVRHPLARLLSAYINKMGMDQYQRRYREVIYKETKYRPPGSDEQNKTDIPVSFRAFVKYVIATQDDKATFNVHWRPLISHLHPCQIHYDFIGKMETIQNDTRYIFKHFFHNPSLSLPRRNMASKAHEESQQYKKSAKEYYAELTPKELEDIISVYSDDFEIFGYPRMVPV